MKTDPSASPVREDAQHTPTPWRVVGPIGYIYATDPYGRGDMLVGQVRGWGHLTGTGGGCAFNEEKAAAIQDANAAFIVRAVNCHDELLAVLKALLEDGTLDQALMEPGRVSLARAAIARAEGRE